MGISVAVYAMRNIIKDPSFGINGMAEFLVNNEINLVEINNSFTKAEEIHQFVQPFLDRGISLIQLTIDGNNFFQKSAEKRKEQMVFMKPWIDAAHSEGIPMVRANMGHKTGFLIPTDTQANLVATFTPIFEYVESLGMKFVFENHGGKSSDVDFQLKIKEAFPSENFGYLLDCGNYKPKNLVYDNIMKLGKSIKIVHAKCYNFDAEGNETQLDYKKIIDNLNAVGFTGDYSIEFEGSAPDIEGVTKTIALLRKYLN